MKYLPALVLLISTAHAAAKFELLEGDRVISIGDAFVERDIQYNYLETLLTAQYPDRKITFRNLGWSGDTVFVPARSGSAPNKGFDLLLEAVKELRPTVLFISYGMNESFEGETGLSRFVDGYNKLLDALGETRARVVLVSPIRHEDLGRPLPDPAEHNRQLKLYTEAISGIAQKRGAWFINLFEYFGAWKGGAVGQHYTDNGIHLNSVGYWMAEEIICNQLGLAVLDRRGIDGKTGAFRDERLENLRQLIRQKNVFFFDRYRPQNDMYIFHGRKHEQGRNAVEIPQFDRFIEEKEAEIAKLKQAK